MPFREFNFKTEQGKQSSRQILEEENSIERKTGKHREEIREGVWRPSIFDEFGDVLGVGASTKELKRLIKREGSKIRITADIERFDKKFSEQDKETRIAKLGAGRILIKLLERIASGLDAHNIEKTSLEHGDNIVVVNQEHLQRDKKERVRIKADGLVTNLREIPLMVTGADCAPVGIYDPKNQAIGVFHSGWQGTLKQISSKGVKKMGEVYGSKPEELLAVVGPYAGGMEYEVSEDEYRRFQEKQDENENLIYTQEDIKVFFRENEKNPSHYFLDTGQAIKISLIKAGLHEGNIQVSQYSTMSEKGNLLFPSERIEGKKERDSLAFMMVLKRFSQ